jgi:4-hydroxybenzoate polyprenyltransferase
MRSLFPSSYDRADVMMSAGCSTFVSAALILVIPRFGTLLPEILLGLFFIGCALMARARLRRLAVGREDAERPRNKTPRWFDRYDVLMIAAVIVVQTSAAGLLRKAGWSEGTLDILPLTLFAAGILLKPRILEFLERRRKAKQAGRSRAEMASLASDGGIQNPDIEA